MGPVDELSDGFGVEIVAERVLLVLAARGVVHAPRLRRTAHHLDTSAVLYQGLHAQVGAFLRELASGHSAGIFAFVDDPHAHTASLHRLGHHAHVAEPLPTEVFGAHVVARFDDYVAEPFLLDSIEVGFNHLFVDFTVPSQYHVVAGLYGWVLKAFQALCVALHHGQHHCRNQKNPFHLS